MLRVYSTADAIHAVVRGEAELLIDLPGDHTGKHAQHLVRNRVWQQVRRRGGPPVSTTVARRDGDRTVFLVRHCPAARRYSPSEKAEMFLAVAVGGLTRQQAAARFGVPRSTIIEVVRELKRDFA